MIFNLKNKIVFSLVFFVLLSCKQKKELANNSFFDFDKIEYYFNDISEVDFGEILMNHDSNNYDDFLKFKIVADYYPEKLSDSIFIPSLTKFGYEKKVLHKKFNQSINGIFSEIKCDEGLVMGCMPNYRDILVFYKENKVIGIAKICFGCRQSYIIGTNKNTQDFGQCGGFEDLQLMLR